MYRTLLTCPLHFCVNLRFHSEFPVTYMQIFSCAKHFVFQFYVRFNDHGSCCQQKFAGQKFCSLENILQLTHLKHGCGVEKEGMRAWIVHLRWHQEASIGQTVVCMRKTRSICDRCMVAIVKDCMVISNLPKVSCVSNLLLKWGRSIPG